LVGNEPGEVTGTNPFLLRNNWDAGYDDGAVLAGITPVEPETLAAVPEPVSMLLLAGSVLGGLYVKRRRSV